MKLASCIIAMAIVAAAGSAKLSIAEDAVAAPNKAAAERVALVIGNSKYAGNAALANPARDVDTIEAALKELDFKVIKKKDLNLEQMQDALVDFRRQLAKGGLGMFYYAGHGVQVSGENYLVPVEARIREEFEVKRQCLEVGQIVDALGESDCNLKVIVLDSCRNNPFKRGWKRSIGNQGLAAINNIPDGTLIAYSTSPGKEAEDGDAENSPFAKNFAAALRSRPEGGLELREVFFEASRAVKRTTGQVPWVNMEASLERYYLRPAGKDMRVVPDPSPTPLPSPNPPSPRVTKELYAGKKAGELRSDNGLEMKLRWCPPGSFRMGVPDPVDVTGLGQVEITLKGGFWLGQYEVTQAEWVKLMATNPSTFYGEGKDSLGVTAAEVKQRLAGMDTDRFPVESVSWEEATKFCQKLTEREQKAGRLPAGWKYDLPSESQWEYACRAGTTTAFHLGDALSGRGANMNGTEPYGTDVTGPSLGRTTAVGTYQRPNNFGLEDMHGNVEEWCRNWMSERYPGAPEYTEGIGKRVLRGGSWYDPGVACQSGWRSGNPPVVHSETYGFRIAVVPVE